MNKPGGLQDYYLNRLRKEAITVVIYLINGYQIRGIIRAFDNFTVIVEGEGKQQMIYKHAISTFVPHSHVSLKKECDDSEETPQ